MVFVTGGSRKYLIRFVRSSICVSTCVCIKALTKIHYSDRIRTGLSLKFPVYRETYGQIASCMCSMGDRKQEIFGHQDELNHHVISSLLKRVHDAIYRRFSRVTPRFIALQATASSEAASIRSKMREHRH